MSENNGAKWVDLFGRKLINIARAKHIIADEYTGAFTPFDPEFPERKYRFGIRVTYENGQESIYFETKQERDEWLMKISDALNCIKIR